eukprot:CFRG3205T1
MAQPGFLGVHDAGGVRKEGYDQKIDRFEPPVAFWERKVHTLIQLLIKRGMLTLDELRLGIEALEESVYFNAMYYEKFAASIARSLLKNGIITLSEFHKEMGIDTSVTRIPPRFNVGDKVTVKKEDYSTHWRKPHLRTPGYIFMSRGEIVSICGEHDSADLLALGSDYSMTQTIYKVRFPQTEIWKAYNENANDTIDVDIFDTWLDFTTSTVEKKGSLPDSHIHEDGHSHEHGHSHDGQVEGGDHIHETRSVVEQTAVDREGVVPPLATVAEAVERLVIAKGYFTQEEMRNEIQIIDSYGKDHAGARLVARAWMDENFKTRLLADSFEPMAEEGVPKPGEVLPKIIVVENTPTVHNVIVCTLCSCYPIALLGLSPPWYKSRSYRARVVMEPRQVLKEFGTNIPTDVAIRVHDSTSEVRYLVIPKRPARTAGWTKEKLVEIITRDSMIGVSEVE